jgi:hypothetical protein
VSDPRVSSLMWRQCVCGEWYWGAPQEGASDPVSEPHVWRTKTSIRDGSSTGRFVVDWEEAEEALDASREQAATEVHRELDVETLVRAMERAMAAVDDEWTIPEFAEITAAEYLRLIEASE